MDFSDDFHVIKTVLIPTILGVLGVFYGLGALVVKRINVRYSHLQKKLGAKPAYLRGWSKALHGLASLIAGAALLGMAMGWRSDRMVIAAVGGSLVLVITAVVAMFTGVPEDIHDQFPDDVGY